MIPLVPYRPNISLTNGFNMDYTGRIFAPNLPSAYQHPNIIDNALSEEVAEHR